MITSRFFQTVNEENVSYFKYFKSAAIVLNLFTYTYVNICKIKSTEITLKKF